MRLIDADALVKHAKRMYTEGEAWQIAPVAVKAVETYDIQRAPTIDAVPVVHGRWLEHPDDRCSLFNGWECSECKQIVSGGKGNYCPNCGAKMDGGENNAHNY